MLGTLGASNVAHADEPKTDVPSADAAKADTAKTDGATDAAKPDAVKPDAAKTDAAKDASTDGTLLVHVDSSKPVVLETRTQSGAPWTRACASPCDVRLPVGVDYRITGDGVTASESFLLDGSRTDPREPITLKVRPASKNKFIIGTAVAGTGAAILVGGIVVLIAAAAGPKEVANDGTTRTGFTDAMWIGTAMVAGGIGTGVFGTTMALANKSTRVRGNVVGPQPRQERASRQPLVREAQALGPSLPAPAFTVSVPLVSGTF